MITVRIPQFAVYQKERVPSAQSSLSQSARPAIIPMSFVNLSVIIMAALYPSAKSGMAVIRSIVIV